MGQLGDFTLDQVAGAVALIISSLGGLLLIIFKSRCSEIKVCWGLWSCIREVPEKQDGDEETPKTPKPSVKPPVQGAVRRP